MRVLIQPRDLAILELARNGITQFDIEWSASYQAKMRRLRKLTKAGFLEMRIHSRQEPNQYFLTDKGEITLKIHERAFKCHTRRSMQFHRQSP